MFFILSKVMGWLLYPLPVVLGLLLVALLCYRRRFGRWLLAVAVLGLYGVSTPACTLWLLEYLEGPYRAPRPLQTHYDAVIVLTGMVRLRIQRPGYIEFNSHVERILAGISLVKRGVADRLLIAGGSGEPSLSTLSEARQLRPFVLEFGLTDAQVLTEERSRNTYENALYSAEIIRQHGFQKLLLVTSAFHMYRSERVFHKQGIFPDLYPVDFVSLGGPRTPFDFLPSVTTLTITTLMIHELVGVLMYRLQGYI
ncbi:MAG: YdcF family protein [Candidatus Tectimicrobiota bacterium]